MNQRKRVIISGLVSAKVKLDEFLPPVREQVKGLHGQIVGELIQRRGVSRSKKPGGSKMLDLPLSSRTYISSGKVDELKELSHELKADLIVFINDLTAKQMETLENLTGLKIEKINVL